jgi:hypothetical protein
METDLHCKAVVFRERCEDGATGVFEFYEPTAQRKCSRPTAPVARTNSSVKQHSTLVSDGLGVRTESR